MPDDGDGKSADTRASGCASPTDEGDMQWIERPRKEHHRVSRSKRRAISVLSSLVVMAGLSVTVLVGSAAATRVTG
jgi:hypothetical protein